MLRAYNAALFPLRAVVPALALWKGRDARSRERWEERRARTLPRARPGGLWIHGASVGEARILRSLVDALRAAEPGLPLAASAVTQTGRAGLPVPPAVDASFFLPLDFAGYPSRILDALRPRALVLVETELWPNLLHEAALHRVEVAVVNARLSPERMARYRRLRGLFGPLLRGIARIGAQSVDEAARFVEIGAPSERVEVTGNVKYDLPVPKVPETELRRRFGLPEGRPVFVAGSTGRGEDGAVLDAFLAARTGSPDLWLVIAPRHPERRDEVEREAQARGLRLHRLSSERNREASGADGLLVDRVGELAALYALATVAFVGGSLVPIGGHNLLEPAAAKVPVLFGPHVDHVANDASALLRAGGAAQVRSSAGLAEALSALLADGARRRAMGEKAADLVRSSRGALQRTVALIRSVLA
jgi:3-deoxy-D-manno-octulosonic-acid transferase